MALPAVAGEDCPYASLGSCSLIGQWDFIVPSHMCAGPPPDGLEEAEGPADGGGGGHQVRVVVAFHSDKFLEMSPLGVKS